MCVSCATLTTTITSITTTSMCITTTSMCITTTSIIMCVMCVMCMCVSCVSPLHVCHLVHVGHSPLCSALRRGRGVVVINACSAQAVPPPLVMLGRTRAQSAFLPFRGGRAFNGLLLGIYPIKGVNTLEP